MDPISHIAFAHLVLGKTFSLPLAIGSVLPDLDKIYTFSHFKFRKAESRTAFQELPVISVISAILIIAGFSEVAKGLLLHFVLDFLTGETQPFDPFSKERVDFNWSIPKKIAGGALLWALYLIKLIKS